MPCLHLTWCRFAELDAVGILHARQMAPRFKDPPHAFRNQNVDTSQCIVVDVRFLKVSAGLSQMNCERTKSSRARPHVLLGHAAKPETILSSAQSVQGSDGHPAPSQKSARQVEAKEGVAVPEEPSLAPASGAWGLLPAFAAGDVATGSCFGK